MKRSFLDFNESKLQIMLLCTYLVISVNCYFSPFALSYSLLLRVLSQRLGIYENLILLWLPFTILDKDPHEILSPVVGFYRYELQKQIHSMS